MSLNGVPAVKLGMLQIFREDGTNVAVTALQVPDLYVVRKKRIETDGYNAVVLAYGPTKEKRLKKPILGVLNKAGLPPLKYMKEIKVDDPDRFEIGSRVELEQIFREGDYVDVSGFAKGKGFMGVVKRWGFSGGPASHGPSLFHRRPGSVGASTDPARVWKGKKMPGREQRKKVTVQNLIIEKIYPDRRVLLVRGAVPGPNRSYVFVRHSVKKGRLNK